MILTYRRVSTDVQEIGLDAQQATIDHWLESRECQTFTDEGVSGAIPMAKRPEGARLLATAVKGDIIVAAKMDRLFRSVADAANTLADWKKAGIKLVAITEGFDMTTAFGRAMAQMASVFAELERAMISERTRNALAAKRLRGERTGSVPFGKRLEHGLLVDDPDEIATLAHMRQWRADGHSLRTIADMLRKAGLRNKNGRKRWCHTSVASILGER